MLSPAQEQLLKDFRRRLILLALISSGIDFALLSVEVPLLPVSSGASLVVGEVVEWLISSLIAKNKMDLKRRYKLAGFIPIPGVTALTLQAVIEYRQSLVAPERVLARFEDT